jgi:acetate---CoA ligase (ADP-forming)
MTVFLSASDAPAELREFGSQIPSYQFPETPAIALARVTRYCEWRDRPESHPPVFSDIRRDEAAGLIAMALEQGDGWLTNVETAKLFSCYGLPLVEQRVVFTPEQAAQAAVQFRGPVALKVIAPGVLHKTEAGGVRLNLAGSEAVRAVALEMQRSMEAQGHEPTGFIVQPMIQGGVEMIVGVVHDPQFGPVIACGAGGTQVEVIRDVSVRLSPLSLEDSREMIQSLKTYPLLTGFRGSAKCDIDALEDGLLRVSAMVEDLPQIAELDCNPFVVREQGAVILDARIRVVAPPARPLRSVRR